MSDNSGWKYTVALLLVISIFACGCNRKAEPLYVSDTFSVYPDRVVQGDFEARAVSPEKIISNYHSPVNEHYSNLITFKFSINEKDNEMASGTDHWLVIDGEKQSPVLKFGEDQGPIPEKSGKMLPENYSYTFRVDMSEVLRDFDEKGYYVTFDGDRLAASDFKALYIAGGSEPLTWDFSNLEENDLEMKDSDKDSIYEITLTLNPTVNGKDVTNTWMLKENVSSKPQYHSDQVLVDALYNMALEEGLLNIEDDSTLRTGEKWGGVWTRDVSYSTILAFAYHEPQVAKISLMKKVKNGRIIQDTGSGGSWPVSSDRIVWATAAWEIYKVTGDRQWLETIYPVIKNTLEDDLKTLYDEERGLFRGESSFLDWREQTYPKWMDNADIFSSENLGTNVLFFRAFGILSEIAEIRGENSGEYRDYARRIAEGINSNLWLKGKNYYAQYLYGRKYKIPSPRFEALGASLSVLFDVADKERAAKIISNAPLTPFGTTCIYPQIPGIPPYHNNGIWPFVQSYWNLAAAKAGNEEVVVKGLAALYRPAALYLSHYENFVASTGDYIGTEINSPRMLWSIAGNIAMVHRMFIGMSFEKNGLRFRPFVPEVYGGTRSLSNFRYRNATLDITVNGYGSGIASFYVDGVQQEEPFLPDSLRGKHNIEINLDESFGPSPGIHSVPNQFSPPAPHVRMDGDVLSWKPVTGASYYKILKNGRFTDSTTSESYLVKDTEPSEYAVAAVNNEGMQSFISEPLTVNVSNEVVIVELEDQAPLSDKPFSNYTGKGFVEVSTDKNTDLDLKVNAKSSGTYFLDVRYSNGTGPWNTDNNCAIRSLYADGDYQGVIVMPQRGIDEWSNWGYSNILKVELREGRNNLKIVYKPWNRNMDGEINRAMIDRIRIVPAP